MLIQVLELLIHRSCPLFLSSCPVKSSSVHRPIFLIMRFSFFIDKIPLWLLKHLLGKLISQVHDHQLCKIPLLFLNGTWHSGNPFSLLFDCCCCSVTQSCPTLCDPMDCSTPSFPVLHYLPEISQSYVHQVSDAIQPSHPLSSPFSPAFNLSQHQGLFQWVSAFHQVAKVLEFQLQHQSFQWLFRVVFLQDWRVWSPCCPRNFQESSPAPQFKNINSLVLSLHYDPTLTSIHDYWKNHSFE